MENCSAFEVRARKSLRQAATPLFLICVLEVFKTNPLFLKGIAVCYEHREFVSTVYP